MLKNKARKKVLDRQIKIQIRKKYGPPIISQKVQSPQVVFKIQKKKSLSNKIRVLSRIQLNGDQLQFQKKAYVRSFLATQMSLKQYERQARQSTPLRVIDLIDYKKIPKVLQWRSKSMTNYLKGYKFYQPHLLNTNKI